MSKVQYQSLMCFESTVIVTRLVKNNTQIQDKNKYKETILEHYTG